MKILVIGNGFDLEHGLPTKYKDFLDFIKTINEIFVNDWFNKGEKEYFSWISGPNGINNSLRKYFLKHNFLNELQDNTQIKELIQQAKDNIWIKYFLENMNYEKEGWIDFESEISYVIQCFDYTKNLSEYLMKYNEWPIDKNRDKYKENIVQKIIKYSDLKIEVFELRDKKLKKIINILNEHLNNLIRCLEIYLEECVGQMEVKCIAPDIKETHFDKVLSFNYTNTYQRVYDIFYHKEYHFIHGKADINRNVGENNMILGIDEYLDNESKNKDLEFLAFKKYFQRIYKKTGNTYKKWIKEMEDAEREKLEKEEKVAQTIARTDDEIMEEVLVNLNKNIKNEIYIFGHSLDITDKDIIKELIECPNTVTTIFYYNKDVYAQQIANLVKIIGQDKLIERVSGANPTIIFKQQSKRIEKI